MRRSTAARISTAIAVAGVSVFTFLQLDPSLLLANTTTAGGDTGAHVALPAFMIQHLLPHFRVTGWDPQWYAGFPAFTFYFPLPSLMIAPLLAVMPYNVAFKLVTVSGILALPVAAWAFGRLSGMKAPGPAVLAVATLPFLFTRAFTIDGGNIASTLAGEYSFAISLSIGLVFLGLVAKGLEDGRHRALAAVLFALTVLAHVVPTFYVMAGAIVLTLMRFTWRRFYWLVTMGLAGGALAAFWLIPFAVRLPYTTNMGWSNITTFSASLLPRSDHWLLALAAIGTLASLFGSRRAGIFLSVMTAASGLAFIFDPQGKLWNGRLLPFWFLGLYLLAGVAVAEVGAELSRLATAARQRRRSDGLGELPAGDGARMPVVRADRAGGQAHGYAPPGALVVPLIALIAAMIFVSVPLELLPSFVPLHPKTPSFIPAWARWNYSGYQGKAAWPQYHSIMTKMSSIGHTYGCGRAMWQYGPQLNQLGTPMALMLLPYWTHGCIDSMEGLLFESSATTPYHFINQAELSTTPSEAMVGLPYGPLDLSLGVAHLQMLGVRYYMAFSPSIEAQAATDPNLRLVGSTGPWPVTYGTTTKQRTWDIYLVKHSAQVASLSYAPAVMTGVPTGGAGWTKTVMPWYLDPARWPVMLAASGPASWPRVRGASATAPRAPVARAGVSHIVVGTSQVSFQVRRTGSPVLVRTSYFPNWQATGATGPYRVAPNEMVVVPTSHRVTVTYGHTAVGFAAWLVTLAGLVGTVVMARSHAVPVAAPGPTGPAEGQDEEPQSGDEAEHGEEVSMTSGRGEQVPAE